jgi:hypothetical protein
MPRDEREQRLIEKTELPEELEEQLDALVPCDLIDLHVLARRIDWSSAQLRREWARDEKAGRFAPNPTQLSDKTWRVSFAEFAKWWKQRSFRIREAQAEAKRKDAVKDLPKSRRRRRMNLPEDVASVRRALRSAGGLEN